MSKLYKTLIFDKELSLSVLDTTDMVNKAIKIHKLSPTASAALGRTMTICSYMASELKTESDKLYVTVSGDGVGGKITVCGDGALNMRGSVDNPRVDLPLKENGKLDVGGFVGKNGRLTVTLSMGLKEPYSGSAKLVSGEIAEDFASYYYLSKQQPTAISLGVKIGKDLTCVGAGGVVITALPYAKQENLIKAEEIINKLSNVSTLIETIGAEGILKEYFGVEKFDSYFPEYKCTCSRKYVKGIILGLGKNEVDDIIKTEGEVKVTCQFCNKEYVFNKEQTDKLFK